MLLQRPKFWMKSIETVSVNVKCVFESFIHKDFTRNPAAARALVASEIEKGWIVVANCNILNANKNASHLIWLKLKSFLNYDITVVLEFFAINCDAIVNSERCISTGISLQINRFHQFYSIKKDLEIIS